VKHVAAKFVVTFKIVMLFACLDSGKHEKSAQSTYKGEACL